MLSNFEEPLLLWWFPLWPLTYDQVVNHSPSENKEWCVKPLRSIALCVFSTELHGQKSTNGSIRITPAVVDCTTNSSTTLLRALRDQFPMRSWFRSPTFRLDVLSPMAETLSIQTDKQLFTSVQRSHSWIDNAERSMAPLTAPRWSNSAPDIYLCCSRFAPWNIAFYSHLDSCVQSLKIRPFWTGRIGFCYCLLKPFPVINLLSCLYSLFESG